MRVVLQHANGIPFETMVSTASAWHNEYATRHHAGYATDIGYYEPAPFSLNSQSVFCLMHWMRKSGENTIIVLLDCDTLVVKPEVWLGDALHDRKEDIALVGRKDWFCNSGMTVVRNTAAARKFYHEVLRLGPGTQTNDQIDVRIHLLSQDEEWSKVVLRLGDKWNWYPSYGAVPRKMDCPEEDAVVRGWHGSPRGEVVELMKLRLATLHRKAA